MRAARGVPEPAGRYLREASGYSVVEVLVAIVVLSVAVIPMVGMFDAGLRAAGAAGHYDEARMLANRELEGARSLPYEEVRDEFPNGTGTPGVSPAQGPPEGFAGVSSYAIEKRYVEQPPDDPASSVVEFGEGGVGDTGLIRLTVTVTWEDGRTYAATGLVAR